jgi:hypothetical protein
VVDQTLMMVSRSQGLVCSASICPPQMSTTVSVDHDRDRCTDVGAGLDALGEGLGDLSESVVPGSVHF